MSLAILQTLQSLIDKPFPEQAPPVPRWIGGILKKIEEGFAEMHITVRPEMLNPLGLLHGGVQSMILDEIIGMTVAAMDKPYPAVSISLNMEFIGKAKEGDTIVAIAKSVRKGRQIIQMEGEIRLLDGSLVSKATSNMLNLLPK
ncbi:MAG: PaaI family thioesterase [Raineya sp.]|jgi:uncharacterized protein (TIGR00369 family)|nr:PaaI family thioesterase [Raineya sp.]